MKSVDRENPHDRCEGEHPKGDVVEVSVGVEVGSIVSKDGLQEHRTEASEAGPQAYCGYSEEEIEGALVCSSGRREKLRLKQRVHLSIVL